MYTVQLIRHVTTGYYAILRHSTATIFDTPVTLGPYKTARTAERAARRFAAKVGVPVAEVHR